VYSIDTMKRIHQTKPLKRIAVGTPFEDLITELLKSTNRGNLSYKWDYTDMTRYALAELWRSRKKKPLPRECEELLPRFYADLDL
jgi:hypothetical protein